ncbi:hypothetical protein [Quisquiliibacterium transsilvanicum]|uniref:MBL fold metallo-hydrolase n=1 Tax=Quisquiliibacterium transsilvanicum TaxID=1549638 RepID=A0A7W8HH85_9BURK|nr:hypothetical protein [Quisquiliibacterium transsilvanicum]MBB5271807.1 hypothetical protein [Quisquiliibacterium transsilvanicum]
MLSVEMLPAAHGDALWVEWGGAGRAEHRLLIDGGPAHAYADGLQRRIEALPAAQRRFALFVISHIDADHIDGALILLQDRKRLGAHFDEIWFNTWRHLPSSERDAYAPLQGEFLGGLLALDETMQACWNRAFEGQAVRVPDVPEHQDPPPLPRHQLPGGATLTLLGPTWADLKRLRARWGAAIRDFAPGDAAEAVRRLQQRREYRPPAGPAVFAGRNYGDDRAPANGSSISFLFEFDGAAVLFAADAHARTLAETLERLCRERHVPKLQLSAIKLPHHGSMSNVDAKWLDLVACRRWLISTSGAVFGHPDVETASLIAERSGPASPPEFHCNYKVATTLRLAEPHFHPLWHCVFPDAPGRTGPAGGLLLRFEGDREAGQTATAATAADAGGPRGRKRAAPPPHGADPAPAPAKPAARRRGARG